MSVMNTFLKIREIEKKEEIRATADKEGEEERAQEMGNQGSRAVAKKKGHGRAKRKSTTASSPPKRRRLNNAESHPLN